MTSDQHHDILEKLAYLVGEQYKYFNMPTTNEHNWEKAKEMMEIELKVNDEEFLLSLLKENKDE